MTEQDEAAVAQRRYEQARPRTEVPIDPKTLDGYVGFYQLAEDTIVSVTREGGRLFCQLTGQPAVEAFPESDRDFFSKVVAAQISFVPDERGRARELILHQNGYDQPAPRIDEALARAAAEKLARKIQENRPDPRSEAALRRHIEAMLRGEPNYAEMGQRLADAVRQQGPVVEAQLRLLGALQLLAFRGVGRDGADVYEARFAGGSTEWRIDLAADGKISGLLLRHLP